MIGISPLLVEAQSMRDARRTLALARSAWSKGNRRLAVSRAVTAVIQATRAASMRTMARSDADQVIQEARNLIHTAALEKAMEETR